MANFQWKNLVSYGPANASATQATTNFTSTGISEVFDNSVYSSNAPDSLVWTGTADVNTPTAAVSASGSQVTSSSGLLFTNSTQNNFGFGLIVQFTTSTTLPTGISAATDYYVVPASSSTYRVATSYANAVAGTYVAYTDTGTGDQTATPVALAGATAILQGSNDNGVTWATVPNSSQTITADGSWVFELDYIRYGAFRTYLSMTTGQIALTKNQIGYRG
jgi:hypothetical protein